MFSTEGNAKAKGEQNTWPVEDLTKYKCPVPAKKGLQNGLGVGGRLDNDRIRETN